MARPRGVGASAGEYPALDYRTVKSKKLKQMDIDIKAVVDSLVSLTDSKSFYNLITAYISSELIDFCVRILRLAVVIAPYDTGELRSSGQVNFFLGAGRTSTLIATVDADSEGNFAINELKSTISKATRRIEAEISFERTDKGVDVALWAHEDLLPWVPRPKTPAQRGKWYAVHPGVEPKSTGPKYLERAVKEHQAELQGLIERATVKAIQEYNRKHSGPSIRRGRR